MILTGQVGRYFWKGIHNRDSPWIKGLVGTFKTRRELRALTLTFITIGHIHVVSLQLSVAEAYQLIKIRTVQALEL